MLITSKKYFTATHELVFDQENGHRSLTKMTDTNNHFRKFWESAGCLMEKAMATHSSPLAWQIPWTEEPGKLQPMGSLSRTWLSDFTFTFHFHALEKGMANYSSVLAWRIPGTGEPGGLPSMGSHRVGHDWSNLAATAAWINKVYSKWVWANSGI